MLFKKCREFIYYLNGRTIAKNKPYVNLFFLFLIIFTVSGNFSIKIK